MGGKEEVVKTGGDNTFIEEMGFNVSEGEGELDETREVGKMLDEEAGELGKLLDEEVGELLDEDGGRWMRCFRGL